MSDGTSIEWAQASWNPALGCDRISSGCDRCYAIGEAHMRAANPNPKIASAFSGLTERRDGRLDWTGRINQIPDRLTQPLTWKKPRKVFVNSLSDMFHDKIDASFIAEVFAVMSLADQHIFQMLTKRHGRMKSLLNSPDFVTVVATYREKHRPGSGAFVWPLPNLHLGVSCEDQHWADIRLPALSATPAAVRWVSAEPLLGPLDLSRWLEDGLSWVVTGGESGPGARPMHVAWARALAGQCRDAAVPYFHKQNGAYALVEDKPQWGDIWVSLDGSTRPWDSDDGHVRSGLAEYRNGDAVLVRRVGKKAAGRLLDGREWNGFPEPQEVAR